MVVVPARSKKLPPLERQAQPHTRADPRPAPSPATGPSTIVDACWRGGRPGTTTSGPEGGTGRRGAEGPGQARPAALVGSGVERFAIYRPDGMALPASAVMLLATTADHGRAMQTGAGLTSPPPPPRSCLSEKLSSARPWAAKDVFRARGRRPLSRPSLGSLAEGSACFARTHAHAPSHHPFPPNTTMDHHHHTRSFSPTAPRSNN